MFRLMYHHTFVHKQSILTLTPLHNISFPKNAEPHRLVYELIFTDHITKLPNPFEKDKSHLNQGKCQIWKEYTERFNRVRD